jgi:hypothetical protein
MIIVIIIIMAKTIHEKIKLDPLTSILQFYVNSGLLNFMQPTFRVT